MGISCLFLVYRSIIYPTPCGFVGLWFSMFSAVLDVVEDGGDLLSVLGL